MATLTFTVTGAKAATPARLDKSVFDVEITHHELLKASYVTNLTNKRRNLAATKTRGLIRGGGKKPWRQKGTGRARFGSSRNPIWRGGGTVFGPTGEENYSRRMPLKAKRTALRQALSLAAREGHILVIEDMKLREAKTVHLKKLLDRIKADGNILIAVAKPSEELQRAARNLPYIHVISATRLTTPRVMDADTIIMTKDALDAISEWLSGGSKV
jgi:large subunit ribosomal protein L4